MATRNQWAARQGRESLSKRLGRKISAALRARDGSCCAYCGATEQSSGSHLHLDHLVPRVSGGSDDPSNLVTACRSCNCARHDMPLAAWCRLIGVDVRRIRRQAARTLQVAA